MLEFRCEHCCTVSCDWFHDMGMVSLYSLTQIYGEIDEYNVGWKNSYAMIRIMLYLPDIEWCIFFRIYIVKEQIRVRAACSRMPGVRLLMSGWNPEPFGRE